VSYGKITLIEISVNVKGVDYLVMKIFEASEDITSKYAYLENKLNCKYVFNNNFNFEDEEKGYFYCPLIKKSIIKNNSDLLLKELKGDIAGVAFLFIKNNFITAFEFLDFFNEEMKEERTVHLLYDKCCKVRDQKHLIAELSTIFYFQNIRNVFKKAYIQHSDYVYYHESFYKECLKVGINSLFKDKIAKKSFLINMIKCIKFYHPLFNSKHIEKMYESDDFEEIGNKKSTGGIKVRLRKLKP
jgi:hypothetical protein